MKHLEQSYATTTAVLAAVPADRWQAATPCTGWTVRDVANHLVTGLKSFAGMVESGDTSIDEGDQLGDDPAGAFRAAADRCLAAFARPGVLAAAHPFPFGDPLSGQMIATISLSESLVHGWDLARGAGLPYEPPSELVAAVLDDARAFEGERPEGMFADPVPTPPDADELTQLLGLVGRKVA